MKCKYCKSDCEPNSFGKSPLYNLWLCHRCYGGISVSYKTEIRDDTPIEITIAVPYEKEMYRITLDLVAKRTTVKPDNYSTELLANFNYVMKITPRIAEDKLKTILTFG